MKRLVLITGIIVYTLFAISAFIVAADEGEDKTEQETTVSQTESNSDKSEDEFILKSYNGRVAVADYNTNKIIWESDTLVEILPEEDQKMLEEGIYIKSIAKLRSYIEDYCS